jgi:hypothetical protein
MINNKMVAVNVQMFASDVVSDDNERLDWASEVWYGVKL